MSSASEHAPPPRTKPTSGLTILLVLLGGSLLAVLLGLVVVAVLVWQNPQGRAIVGIVGETMRIMQKAHKAPGTKELRAMGCRQSMVLDMDELAQLVSQLDAGAQPPPNAFGSMVICSAAP